MSGSGNGDRLRNLQERMTKSPYAVGSYFELFSVYSGDPEPCWHLTPQRQKKLLTPLGLSKERGGARLLGRRGSNPGGEEEPLQMQGRTERRSKKS